jgi:RNA polymerase sigma factor for flagellar operon FliA
MPHTIDLGDLVQDGMVGLIDAAHRYDDGRGIKFETFAERRVRGAMIDALRKDAWPRGVRRQRRELEAAREALRRETGCEPSLADLAARVGTDEARLGRTIVRISTIESTSMLSSPDGPSEVMLPDVCVPPETPTPDRAYEASESRSRVRRALQTLPPRERKVIGLYYFRDVTMKQIGAEIGVNESRVSQLHARAIQRLQKALGGGFSTTSLAAFQAAKARQAERQAFEGVEVMTPAAAASAPRGVVVPYPATSRTTRNSSDSRNGLGSQRQPLSTRKRSASAPTTSPVTKITRRANAG